MSGAKLSAHRDMYRFERDIRPPLHGLLPPWTSEESPAAGRPLGQAPGCDRRSARVSSTVSAVKNDLNVFAALVEPTSRRQGLASYPSRYYRAMRELFAPTEHACLVLADHGAGRSRSIAYGDFAIDKMGGWSAERGTLHSNELLAVGPGAQVPQI